MKSAKLIATGFFLGAIFQIPIQQAMATEIDSVDAFIITLVLLFVGCAVRFRYDLISRTIVILTFFMGTLAGGKLALTKQDTLEILLEAVLTWILVLSGVGGASIAMSGKR